jgi:hypothetical protein
MVLGDCLLSLELRNHDDGLFHALIQVSQGDVPPVGTHECKCAGDKQAPVS